MANLAPTWVTTAGFGVLTLNSGLAIYRAWGDLVSILFVSGWYTTLLLLFFRCLRDYERARRAVWQPRLTTLLTLAFGVQNCDMALAIHKARSDPGSATCVLVLATYAALLALVWLLVREFAGHARGVVVGYEQDDKGQGGDSVGAACAAQ